MGYEHSIDKLFGGYLSNKGLVNSSNLRQNGRKKEEVQKADAANEV
jgi:hypothetical protein